MKSYPQLCYRQLNLLSYGALLLFFLVTNLWAAEGSVFRWLIQTVPLLLVLPSLLKGHHRGYSWLCFIILLYFTAYVVEVMTPHVSWEKTWPSALALSLTVMIFVTAMMTSRRLQQRANDQAHPITSDDKH